MIHFKNAQVVTMERQGHYAHGFTVEGDRFHEVFDGPQGPSPQASQISDTVDLKGRVVIPGIVESHGHLIWTGLMGTRLDLRQARSFAEVCARLRVYGAEHPEREWLIGEGWDQNNWSDLGAGEALALGDAQVVQLEGAAPGRRVYLTRVDGHGAIASSAALAAAGVTRETPVPHGGLIGRTPSGALSGLLIDTAMSLVAEHIPPPSDKEMEKALTWALGEMRRFGVTSFHECGSNDTEIQLFEAFRARGALTCRMHVMVDGTREKLREEWLERGPQALSKDGVLQIRAIKMFADGALGSRGALLSRPYEDDSKTSGIEIASSPLIKAVALRGLKAGFQVATHAIGDLACTNTLDAYEGACVDARRKDLTDARFRIEHAQMVTASDVERMGRLGVIASVQCIHCSDDRGFAAVRLGRDRLGTIAYRWKSFLSAGVKLANGSDTPVVPSRPFLGMKAAVGGDLPSGASDHSNRAGERLSSWEALAAMTVGGAYAAFMERFSGSIAPGKFADFVVLDRDPLTCPPAELDSIRVLETWFGGRRIFAA